MFRQLEAKAKPILLAVEPDDLRKIVVLRQVVGLDITVIGEADPRLLIGTAQFFRHCGYNSEGC